MAAYYNEIDPYAAAWLRNLIAAGHIAPGVVDERDIRDVRPDELREFTQCHFFAGIGVWSYALRRAGWPDSRPVWTGSCPCQPFSAAGRGDGFADERHLWPHWFHLIEIAHPAVVFGEQVASKDGLGWLDLVQADLEGAGYATGAVDLCAAGVGAPHIRQRLWFVAERAGVTLGDALGAGLEGHAGDGNGATGRAQPGGSTAPAGGAGGMAKPDSQRRKHEPHARPAGLLGATHGATEQRDEPCDNSPSAGGLAHHHHHGRQGQPGAGLQRAEVHDADGCGECGGLADAAHRDRRSGERAAQEGAGAHEVGRGRPAGGGAGCGDGPTGPTHGHWGAADWLLCRDGKWRPVEPGTFPLAHGTSPDMGCVRPGEASPHRTIFDAEGRPIGQTPWRIGMLRGYGNAIVAPVAEAWVGVCLEEFVLS